MNDLEIKVLSTNDWKIYKELRLSSLKDSPDSFGSTYEREVEFDDNTWISRLERKGKENSILPLVIEHKKKPIGLAFGVQHDSKDRSAHIYQMWVSPNARGLGAGKLLLDHIISWAKEIKLESVHLAVTTVNVAAFNLYKSMGFEAFGEKEELREGSPFDVQPMKLDLINTSA